MFHKDPIAKLVTDAWSDFKDRLRWRAHFDKESALSNEVKKDLYDPAYRVPKDRKKFEGELDAYIELGLKAGDSYVNDYVRNVVPGLQPDRSLSGLVQVAELKSYLEENEYLVSMTDKNLGVAIITKRWFIENSTKLWNDPLNYEKLSKEQRQSELTRKHRRAREIATLALMLPEPHEQLFEFLLSKVPANDTDESPVPVFYGIPKIHKQPVKMRPIVPCHSNVQSPFAVYVSKMLKPMVKKQPYVLHGSKDLSIKLSKVKLDKGRKAWIITVAAHDQAEDRDHPTKQIPGRLVRRQGSTRAQTEAMAHPLADIDHKAGMVHRRRAQAGVTSADASVTSWRVVASYRTTYRPGSSQKTIAATWCWETAIGCLVDRTGSPCSRMWTEYWRRSAEAEAEAEQMVQETGPRTGDEA